MLPRKNRLSARERLKNPQTNSSTYFSIRSTHSSVNVTRVAFIISKKVYKLAVKRNQLRRNLMNSLISILPQIKPPTDIVFYVKPTILNLNLDNLNKELDFILKKAGLI